MKRAIAAAFILMSSMFVQAQEVDVATSLICDTQKQIERFAELYPSQKHNAIKIVNDEEKTLACGILSIAFIRGDVVSRVEIDGSSFIVAPVIVVAVKIDTGWLQGQPIQQFILLKGEDKQI